MSRDTKGARPSTAIPERDTMGAGAAGEAATTSRQNDTTAAAGRQLHIYDFLGHGQKTAVPLRHLEKLANRPGRAVRKMIQAERLRGVSILSDSSNCGYYLPENDVERDRFVKGMKRRAKEIVKVAEAVQKGENYTG